MTTRPTPAARAPIPQWVRAITLSAVALVALVAAVMSYVHMHQLAADAGEGWRAILVPLSVDGMLVAASMVMFVRRRDGEKAGFLPWLGLVLGILASLGANIAAGRPDWRPGWLPAVIAAWPPIALAVGFELLILVNRHGGDSAGPATSSAGPTTDEPHEADDGLDDGEQPEDPDARARELIAAGAGRPRLARELEISDHQARQLIERLRPTNGHRVLTEEGRPS